MKYVPSALIGRLSRSAGSTTAGHNRYGSYLRNRVIPTNPVTAAQTAVRDQFADASIAWRNLTALQRSGWESLAPDIVRTDSLGETYTLNGQTAYMYVNRNRLTLGQSQLSDAPAVNPPPALLTGEATIGVALPVHDIDYTATPLGANDRLLIFATRGVSPGKKFLPNGDYKLVQITALAAASPADIDTDYRAIFGPPVTGEKIFYKLKVIRQTTGQSNSTLQFSAIVGA